MSGVKDLLAEVFFPHACFLCGKVLQPRQQLCEVCAQEACYIFPPVCALCGRSKDACCCGGRRRHFERCVSPFCYEGVVERGISYLKNDGYTDTVEGFAAHMAEVVRREYGGIAFSLVTAVPLHLAERRRRGFDQSQRLARSLARRLGIPFVPALCKLVHTRPQKELSALERSGNLLGVFDVTSSKVENGTVLLVDDVITTGSTLDECAKMLKIYGAREVYGVTAAAAVLKKDDI